MTLQVFVLENEPSNA